MSAYHENPLAYGKELYKKHQYKEAIQEFSKILIEEPTNLEARIGEYLALYDSSNVDKAASKLKAFASTKIGKFYTASNHSSPKEVAELYKQIIRVTNHHEIQLVDRIAIALAHNALGSYRTASDIYSDIIHKQLYSDISQIYYLRAQARACLGNYDDSRQDAHIASASAATSEDKGHNPKYIDALIHEAKMEYMEYKMEYKLDNYSRAIALLDEAASANIHDTAALKVKAEIAYQQKDYITSIKACESAISMNPTADIHYCKATALLNSYSREEAIISDTKAIELEPKNPLYYFHRGAVHAALHHQKDAFKDFKMGYDLSGAGKDSLQEKLYQLIANDVKPFYPSTKIIAELAALREQKINIILKLVEYLGESNGMQPNIGTEKQHIDFLLSQTNELQHKLIANMEDHETIHLAQIHGNRDLERYYDAFVATLNQLYTTHTRGTHPSSSNTSSHGSGLALVIHSISSAFDISQDAAHAENLLQIAPNPQTFDMFARYVGIKHTLDADIARKILSASIANPRIKYLESSTSTTPHQHKEKTTAPFSSDKNMIERIANHEAVKLIKLLYSGNTAACPSEELVDRICQLLKIDTQHTADTFGGAEHNSGFSTPMAGSGYNTPVYERVDDDERLYETPATGINGEDDEAYV